MSFSSDIKAEILNKMEGITDSKLRLAESFGEYSTGWYTKQEVPVEYATFLEIANLTENTIKAILMGAFLSSGYLTNPHTDYHLEILVKAKVFAGYFTHLLSVLDFSPKMIKRKKGKTTHYVVYLKEADQISTYLSILGVSSSLLTFEQIRVEKDVKNNINRAINCETANLSKTIKASLIQLQAIEKLRVSNQFEQLHPRLKQVAILREQHPNDSLEELAALLNISKSGIKHRLDKLIQLAKR